eukprot:283792-Pelagomonas_calceolata.AAC.8
MHVCITQGHNSEVETAKRAQEGATVTGHSACPSLGPTPPPRLYQWRAKGMANALNYRPADPEVVAVRCSLKLL